MKKILIVQYRHGEQCAQEQRCFEAEMPEYKEHFWFVNGVEQPFPEDLSDVAGVIVAGSSEYCLSEGAGEEGWKQRTFDFLDRVLEADIPTLGICFGFQLISAHQGAQIIRDMERKQSGTFTVKRGAHGKADELFGHLPEEHVAIFAHKDVVVEAPEHIIPMCATPLVDCTSFRIKNKAVWGTLFHPELDGPRIVERLKLLPQDVQETYMGKRTHEEVEAMYEPTPEAASVLNRFAQIALGE